MRIFEGFGMASRMDIAKARPKAQNAARKGVDDIAVPGVILHSFLVKRKNDSQE